ncbi:hypothetical protein BHS06_17465 [Myxococcus xanthus]|uniref:hypothetical protein n=1 Tax=Myxococcus xanthus TaxID=34 RepID=UPI00112D82A2|nr:hypothetical protein [Myxococcus xanthus]QDE90606.1 hypothetical protein BHS06_17465 [Myxococcus xanthus]
MHSLSLPPEGPTADAALCLRIAGWTGVVEVGDAGLRDSLRRMFSRFVVSPRRQGSEVARLVAVAPAQARPAPVIRELPRVLREEDGALRLAGEDYDATLSADGLQAHVEGQGRFPVETVLKVMLARALARRGGLLVHGVAVAHQGKAALFTGHSGAGKSTLGALWAQAGGQVLSDELVAVWPEPGQGWRAAGTPWNVGQAAEAELSAVGTLAWDVVSRWEPQAAGDVGRMLLVNALLPEATPVGRGGLLGAAGRLLSEVSPVRLVFARDASAAAAIQGALANG